MLPINKIIENLREKVILKKKNNHILFNDFIIILENIIININ